MHPTNPDNRRQLLLISNSTVHGRSYLDHVEHDIRALLGRVTQILFIPFALQDRAYTAKARAWFHHMDVALASVHDVSNVPRAIDEAEAVFIGGGNTFRLLIFDSTGMALQDVAAAAMVFEKWEATPRSPSPVDRELHRTNPEPSTYTTDEESK